VVNSALQCFATAVMLLDGFLAGDGRISPKCDQGAVQYAGMPIDSPSLCVCEGNLPITQTNTDCTSSQQHNDSKKSAPRRVCSVFFFKDKAGGKDVFDSIEEAWELLTTYPIYNAITLYSTVQIPTKPATQSATTQP